MLQQQQLQKYAEIIVKIGANVQPGQPVRLSAETDQLPLVQAVTEECYRAGAKYVDVRWNAGSISRLHYQYATAETLGEVPAWEEARAQQMVKELPVSIYISSEDPDKFSGLSAEKIAQVGQMRGKVLKKYFDALDGKYQWLIVAAASPAWAKKVFPGMAEEEAVDKLWAAIFSCMYMDLPQDPVAVWKKHTADCKARCDWLNAQHFTRLHYSSKNGTDFTVGLIPGAKWCGAADVNHANQVSYVPNMPTEEVFTSPMRGQAEGTLVATKPLSCAGQLVEDFTVTFKAGRVVSCQAKKGKEALEKMFAMDEGASMLGEVALVPKESPINQTGILFYNTLFDENACCHVAAGEGFNEVLDGFQEMTDEQILEKGVNDSIIHEDFMIGSEDLNIVGYRADGTSADIFINGTWAEGTI